MKIKLVMESVHDDGEVYRDSYVFDGDVSHVVGLSNPAGLRLTASNFSEFPDYESELVEWSPIACDEVGSWVLISLEIVEGA